MGKNGLAWRCVLALACCGGGAYLGLELIGGVMGMAVTALMIAGGIWPLFQWLQGEQEET
ncbi:hypothetical protein ACLBXM_22830 [Xanthobacteraceae bacterium A53D]